MTSKPDKLLPFNSQAVMKAGPLEGKQTEYRIEGERGLVMVVTKLGVASFVFKYQAGSGSARKFRVVNIGRRDEVSLHDARKRAAELRTAVGRGEDPALEQAVKSSAKTLRVLFEERLAIDKTKAASTMTYYRQALELDVFPELGNLPVDMISADQIAAVLRKAEQRSKAAAHAARSAIGSTYRWAYKRRMAKTNPTIGLGFSHKSKPRTRNMKSAELKKLWQAIEAAQGSGLSEQMAIVLKLTILTGQRVGQVVAATRSELTGLEAANPMWRIPAEKMKRKDRDQHPLSKQAAGLFKRAIELSVGSESGFVFPSSTSRVRIGQKPRLPHIHRHSVATAMARLCADVGVKISDLHVHDFRKVVVTWLRENRHTPSDVCDLILHHAPRGVTGTHYDFAILEGPVREALQFWADHVEAVVSGADDTVSNVVKLRKTEAVA